ncbi:MAG TPA: FKBP-type peptidyl-prolyl cis-trans isomerase [Steroidobacteraceae bacterium]|jgi:FKBP-type peptidyl-prolyl cis-trans isomerase|nr:FKBP-type peptidyl-prolyl cis-trans isomerase [Steroidobacteraceae bacterium]
MTLRPDRVTSCVRAALATLLLGATVAALAQPAAPAAQPAAPTAKPAAAEKEAGAGKAPAAHSTSYIIGVVTVEQMIRTGLPAEHLDKAAFDQGMHDALAGKAESNDADHQALDKLVRDYSEENKAAATQYLAANGKKPGVVTTASGLQYKVLRAGSGESPKPSDEVTVNYRGTFMNGREFDSSYKRGEPTTFPLNRVIPAWTEGVGLMKPGGKYMLYVPPDLGYGFRPHAKIPPGSLLIFEVELLSAKPQVMPSTPNPAPPPPPPPK